MQWMLREIERSGPLQILDAGSPSNARRREKEEFATPKVKKTERNPLDWRCIAVMQREV
jgi:hypothetical protein